MKRLIYLFLSCAAGIALGVTNSWDVATDRSNATWSLNNDFMGDSDYQHLVVWFTTTPPINSAWQPFPVTNSVMGNLGVGGGSFAQQAQTQTYCRIVNKSIGGTNGMVFSFNNTNSTCYCSAPKSYTNGYQITLMGWFHPTNISMSLPDGYHALMNVNSSTFILYLYFGVGTIRFQNNGTGSAYWTTPNTIISPGNGDATPWIHFAATVDAQQNVKFYSNGVSASISNIGGTNLTTYSNISLNLGTFFAADQQYSRAFLGNMNDVRIYDVAETSAQIGTIFTNTKARYGL